MADQKFVLSSLDGEDPAFCVFGTAWLRHWLRLRTHRCFHWELWFTLFGSGFFVVDVFDGFLEEGEQVGGRIAFLLSFGGRLLFLGVVGR